MLSPAITQMSPFLSGNAPPAGSSAREDTANRPSASNAKIRVRRTVGTPGASVMTQDRVWLVRLFQSLDFRGVEFEYEGGEGVVEMMRLRGADDRGGHAGLVH